MPFDWRERDSLDLSQRYRAIDEEERRIDGADAWFQFIDSIAPLQRIELEQGFVLEEHPLLTPFRHFLAAIDNARRQRSATIVRFAYPIVFVSHQRSDLAEAERIAYLATLAGIDYWLDVHDPLLQIANQTISPNDPRYPYIIAAIIEMALLNSSHLIAVHTTNSLASKWVPYELGRVRDQNLQSANAGGWFHPTLSPRQCGDYVHLCGIARGGEAVVNGWLGGWRRSWPSSSARRPAWKGGPTAQLP